jgi:hypothetical protein
MICKELTLYNAISSTPLTSAEFIIHPKEKSIIIDISGTNTARTIAFYAKFSKNDANPILFQASNVSTLTLASGTTSNNEKWQFDDIEGLYSILIGVTVLSGGNLTIKAKGIE